MEVASLVPRLWVRNWWSEGRRFYWSDFGSQQCNSCMCTIFRQTSMILLSNTTLSNTDLVIRCWKALWFVNALLLWSRLIPMFSRRVHHHAVTYHIHPLAHALILIWRTLTFLHTLVWNSPIAVSWLFCSLQKLSEVATGASDSKVSSSNSG